MIDIELIYDLLMLFESNVHSHVILKNKKGSTRMSVKTAARSTTYLRVTAKSDTVILETRGKSPLFSLKSPTSYGGIMQSFGRS